jgi:glycosyltransferase 2 family protein
MLIQYPGRRERWIRIAFVVMAIPYGIILTLDTFGWRNTFEHPERLRFLTLWRVRIATEAVSNSLPAGPAIGETLKAVILQRRLGMPLTEAAANVILAKFAIAIAQALFTVTALVLAAPLLQENSRSLLGREGLEWYAFVVALGFLAIATLGLWAVVRGKLLGRILEQVSSIGGDRLRNRLERFVPVVQRADHALGLVARLPRARTAKAIGLFLCGFVCMGFEDWLILTFLSAGVSIPEAISMEALLALVRIGFFFLPSALGAQEAGYYLALRAFGVAEPEVLAAAFMVAKRAKELVWIGLGYALLSSLQVHVADARSQEPITTP